MRITRIHSYDDPRFSKKVLLQHGAFLADGTPCSFEILGQNSAVLRCPNDWGRREREELIEEFRFFAEHITVFYDEAGKLIRRYPPVTLFEVPLLQIQPSQFYVDADKLAAVTSFVRSKEDVVIPFIREEETGRYISLDGHTRLYRAHLLGLKTVRGFLAKDEGGYIKGFAAAAKKRGVFSPQDIMLLSHEQYQKKWDDFCDAFFARRKGEENDSENHGFCTN